MFGNIKSKTSFKTHQYKNVHNHCNVTVIALKQLPSDAVIVGFGVKTSSILDVMVGCDAASGFWRTCGSFKEHSNSEKKNKHHSLNGHTHFTDKNRQKCSLRGTRTRFHLTQTFEKGLTIKSGHIGHTGHHREAQNDEATA